MSYDGPPLYLFSREKLGLTPRGIQTAGDGNGNGRSVGGGTFSLIDV